MNKVIASLVVLLLTVGAAYSQGSEGVSFAKQQSMSVEIPPEDGWESIATSTKDSIQYFTRVDSIMRSNWHVTFPLMTRTRGLDVITFISGNCVDNKFATLGRVSIDHEFKSFSWLDRVRKFPQPVTRIAEKGTIVYIALDYACDKAYYEHAITPVPKPKTTPKKKTK